MLDFGTFLGRLSIRDRFGIGEIGRSLLTPSHETLPDGTPMPPDAVWDVAAIEVLDRQDDLPRAAVDAVGPVDGSGGLVEIRDFDARSDCLVLGYDPRAIANPVVTVEPVFSAGGRACMVFLQGAPACRVTLAPGSAPVTPNDVALVPEQDMDGLQRRAA